MAKLKQTAGTLLFRYKRRQLQVLLVHASGNYNKKAAWSIPKGLPDDDESFEEAARRETLEETGVEADELDYLGHADYTKSKKRIHCFCGPSPEDAKPVCASWEVDRAEFVSLEEAKRILHQDQTTFLDRLEIWLEDYLEAQQSTRKSATKRTKG